MINRLEQILKTFTCINLEDSTKVKFQKRCDYKFVLHSEMLLHVLESVNEDYYVMNICDKPIQEYTTTYFEREDNFFYNSHHNGKNNRLKVRKRCYQNSNEKYLEVKQKSLSGFMTKKRMKIDSDVSSPMNEEELDFLKLHLGERYSELSPVMTTSFNRITLVAKDFRERVTIDISLAFHNCTDTYELGNLIIVEIKSNKHCGNTVLKTALKQNNIKSSGFSKYCVGRAVLEEDLKRNLFKKQLKLIKQLADNGIIQN